MLFSTLASIEFISYAALASTDQDGDGLTYGLEYLINTQPNDWDSDNDQLPDGWEWQYGLDPLSASNEDGAIGDPDGDGFSNLTRVQLQTAIKLGFEFNLHCAGQRRLVEWYCTSQRLG